ncbi:MAG: signal peptidase II [Lachnospiraceae bacterium]|nr:signal peptidase II [Lachnospiraceae bacterium]
MDTKIVKRKRFRIIMDVLITILLIVGDQVSKHYAVVYLKGKSPIVLIKDVLQLQYLENRGAAFGMLQNQKVFFVLIAVIILLVILYVMIKMPGYRKYDGLNFFLVLIASGAIGNMIDRLIQDYVVDFIYFSLIDFPIFNVADIYVTCSTVLLVIALLFVYKENDFAFLSLKPQLTRDPEQYRERNHK